MIRLYWHIHHLKLVEYYYGFIKGRRKYIKENKPKDEKALRLRLLKRVKGKLSKRLLKHIEVWGINYLNSKDLLELEKLHLRECKNCTWDGETIFSFKDNRDDYLKKLKRRIKISNSLKRRNKK